MYLIGGFLLLALIYWKPLKFLEYYYRLKEFVFKSNSVSTKFYENFNILEINVKGRNIFLINNYCPNCFSSVILKSENIDIECTQLLNFFIQPNIILDLKKIIPFILYYKRIQNQDEKNFSWDIITNKADFLKGNNMVVKIDNNFNVTTI